MTTATLQKEIRALKRRQTKLEETLEHFLTRTTAIREEVRPEYLKKLERIRKDMDKGKGVTVVRNKKELDGFFRSL